MTQTENTKQTKQKKLYRSKTNKVFAGICAGIANYFDMDTTLVRVIWLLTVIFSGIFPGVLAYIIMIFVIPQES